MRQVDDVKSNQDEEERQQIADPADPGDDLCTDRVSDEEQDGQEGDPAVHEVAEKEIKERGNAGEQDDVQAMVLAGIGEKLRLLVLLPVDVRVWPLADVPADEAENVMEGERSAQFTQVQL